MGVRIQGEGVSQNPRILGCLRVLPVAALFASGGAMAEESWYGRVDGGYSVDSELEVDISAPFSSSPSVEEGAFASIGLGYSVKDNWRLELELAHRKMGVDADLQLDRGGDVNLSTLFFNVYHDFASGGSLRPYVGAGAGFSRIDLSLANNAPLNPVVIDGRSTNLSYQLLIGIAVPATKSMQIDIGYRYLGGISADGEAIMLPPTPTHYDSNFSTHGMTFGVRWEF